MKALLFDLDGVIYQAREPIPGAREAIAWVRAEKIPHLFVTNTTSRPLSWLLKRLREMDIPVEPDQILTPAVVGRRWLETHVDGPVALLVPDRTAEDFNGIEQLPQGAETEGVAAVVIGNCGKAWDYALLNWAFRLLMARPETPLVALGVPRYWQGPEGLRLDAGPFVAALEYATGKKALVLGKPAPEFYRAALEVLGTEAAATVMIGDDIRGDVGGAQRAGLKGVLVKTGKFRPADLEDGIQPDAVLDSVADLPGWWANGQQPGGAEKPSTAL